MLFTLKRGLLANVLLLGGLLPVIQVPHTAMADGTPHFELIQSFSCSPERPARAGIVKHDSGIIATASVGGNFNCGTIFRAQATTTSQAVHFTGQTGQFKGASPSGALVVDDANFVWGVTTRGGLNDAGTIYRFNPNTGAFVTVLEFGAMVAGGNDIMGRNPTIGLVKDGNGMLWGISGGSPAIIYMLNPVNGLPQAVTAVSPTEAQQLGLTPSGELAFDGVDSLWGATVDGGPSGLGRVYKVNQHTGSVTVVANLTGNAGPAPGKAPAGPLALDTATGSMLGLCAPIEASGSAGRIYKIAIAGLQYTVAGTLPINGPFTGVTGGLVDMQDGFFAGLGTTSGSNYGCLFIWKPVVPNASQVFPFAAHTHVTRGLDPVALIATAQGEVAGTTAMGGSGGKGGVFYFQGGFTTFASLPSSMPETYVGSNPAGGLIEGVNGRLIGLNQSGGVYGGGTIYGVSPALDTQVQVIGTFFYPGLTARNPVGELTKTLDRHGRSLLFGQTTGSSSAGNTSSIFKMMDFGYQYSNGGALHSADVVASPNGGLVLGSNSRLWSAAGNVLYSFPADYQSGSAAKTEFTFTGIAGHVPGSLPSSRLFKSSQGALWGTTEKGGTDDHGTIYKVVESHVPTFTSVASFTGSGGARPGSRPNGPLMEDGAGFLWGTTAEGGAGGKGTVFKVKISDGAFTTVATFGSEHYMVKAATPKTGLTADGRGYLWGTTSAGGQAGYGVIFRLELATENVEIMFEFTGSQPQVPGMTPSSPLLLHSDGNLYGTTPGLSAAKHSTSGTGGNVFRLRFGRHLAVEMASQPLVDGAEMTDIVAQQLLGVQDVEDSRTLQLLVTNRSSSEMIGFAAQFTGPNASDYTLQGGVPTTLGPGESFMVGLKFDPSAIGVRNAVLTFGGSSPDTDAFVIPLAGTGVQRTVAFEEIGVALNEIKDRRTGIVVRLSAPLTKVLKVPFTISLGTASKSDFTVSASPLIFPAGATTATIWLTGKSDHLVEENETFTLVLGTPAHPNVSLTSNSLYQACGITILNDDETPTMSDGGGGVYLLGEAFGVASNLSNPSNIPFTGTWRRNGRVIPGATQPFYSAAKATAAHAGIYQYSIKTIHGVTVTGEPFPVWVIDSRPHVVGLSPGKAVSLALVAEGPDLGFRWVRVVGDSEVPINNGGRYSAATTNTLKISPSESGDAGLYRCYGSVFGAIDFQLVAPTLVPVVPAPEFPTGYVGRIYEYTLPRTGSPESAAVTVTATGLPLGLTCDPYTGFISGRPAQYGRFKVTVTMTNAKGKDSEIAYLDVEKLPDHLTGKYVAVTGASPDGSRMDLTLSSSGAVTGHLTSGTHRRSFSGRIETSGESETAQCYLVLPGSNSSSTPALQFDLIFGPDDHLTGSVEGWRQTWHATTKPASHLRRYHNFAVMGQEGVVLGHGSLTISLDGTTVVSGRLVDDSAFTSTAFLSPGNFFLVYQSLYSEKGGMYLMGSIEPGTLETDHDVFANTSGGVWNLPLRPATTRYTKNPFFNNTSYYLTLVGSSYVKPPTGECLLGLPVVPVGGYNAQFRFGISSVIVPTAPDVVLRVGTNHVATLPAAGSVANPGRVSKVSFDATYGTFTGTFTVDHGTAKARTATFTGRVIPGAQTGMGYFVIASPADPFVYPAVTVKTSHLEPGSVYLEPYVAPAAP